MYICHNQLRYLQCCVDHHFRLVLDVTGFAKISPNVEERLSVTCHQVYMIYLLCTLRPSSYSFPFRDLDGLCTLPGLTALCSCLLLPPSFIHPIQFPLNPPNSFFPFLPSCLPLTRDLNPVQIK